MERKIYIYIHVERERRKGRTNPRVRNLSLLQDYRLSVSVVRPLRARSYFLKFTFVYISGKRKRERERFVEFQILENRRFFKLIITGVIITK